MPSLSLTEIDLEAAIAPPPPLVTPETPVTEAIALMSAARANCSLSAEESAKPATSCVLVVKGNHLLGIFTERDVVRLSAQGRPLAEIAIAEVMAQPVITLRRSEFTDIFTALNLLQAHHLRHLPLLDDDERILGILTQTSLLNSFNPLELYKLVESLEAKVSRLEAEKRAWLEIRNVELEQEVQARTAQLQAQVKGEQLLAAIANRIRSSLNWQEILDKTVREVRSFLGCDSVVIWQFQPDGSGVAVAESAASNQPSYLGRKIDDPCFSPDWVTTYSNERIRVVPDIYTSEMSDCHREFLEQLGIRAKILVPIFQGETLWGMLSAIESQIPRQWQTSETELLQQLATQLAIALQQATAYQQAESELAERRRVEAALQWQIEFDRLIAHISNRFMQLSFPELSHGIAHALQHMGEFLQVDTSYVFQYGEDRQTFSMIHEWIAEGLPPQLKNCQNLPCAAFPWATDLIGRGESFAVSSLDKLPPEATIDRQGWQNFGIKSVLFIPLRNRDQVIGFAGFASFRREEIWSDNTMQILQIFSEILTYVMQRQQAETELELSERRYASLAEAAPVGIFRTDTQGSCVYVNDRWCLMTGLPAAASLGTGWAAFIHPDDLDRVVREWQRFIQENNISQHEFRVQNSEGQISWVFGQAVPEYDAKGQIIGYIGTVTDISERKRAEEALVASERRLRTIIDAEPECVKILAADGTILEMNPAGLAMLEADTPSQVIGQKATSCILPEHREAFAALGQQVFQGETGQLEFVILGLKGSRRWVDSRAVPLCNEQNETVGILTITRDITDRKQAEMALQASEDRLKEAQQIAHLGSWELTLPTNTLLWSDEIYRIFEIDPQRFGATYEAFLEAIHPDDRAMVNQAYTDSLKNRTPYTIVHRLLMADGRIKHVQEQCQTFYDERGQPIRSMGTLQDITERKQAEIALAESERRLSTLIANLPGFVYRVRNDPNYTPEFLSQGVEDLTGYRPEEYLVEPSITIERVIHPDDVDRVWQIIQTGVRDRQSYQCEYRLITKTGQEKWVWEGGKGIYAEDGSLLWLEGFVTDISERKAAQAALRDNEERLRLALNASNQGLYDLNIQTGEAIVNAEYALMLGYEPAEFQETNAKWIERLHPDDREFVAAIYRAYINREIPEYRVEFRQSTKTGDWKWILSLGKIVAWDEEGNPSRMLGIHTDISGRKQAEQELQQTRNFLQTVIDHLPVAVFVKDGREEHFGEFRLWNRTSELMFGLTAEQAIDKTVHDYFPPEQADFFDQKDREAFERGVPEDIPEEPIDSYSLGRRILHTVKVPIYDDSQAPQYLLCFSEDITERKRIEQALQDSENRLSNLIANLPGYVYRVANDPNYTPEFISEGVYKITGYRREEYLVDRTISCRQEIHPDDAEAIWNLVQSALERKQAYECEYRIITKTGETKWVWERGRGCWTQSGELVFLEGFVTDISDRKQAELALLQSYQQYDNLVNGIPIGVYKFRMLADGQQRFDYVSPRWCALTQVSQEEVLQDASLAFQCVHPDELDRFIRLNDQVRSTLQSFVWEGRMVIGDEVRWMHIESSPTLLENGDLVWDGIQYDITERQAALRERKRAEEALRDSEERFRQMAENIGEVFWMADRDFRQILYVNPAYEEIWGRSRTSLYADPYSFLEAILPEDREGVSAKILEQRESGWNLEYRIAQPDGSLRWIWERAFPVRDGSGQIHRVVGISQDITPRKQAEEKLRQLNETLEEEVARRTAELETLLNTLPDYVFVVDRQQMRISFCNDIFAQGIGFAHRQQVQGKTISECFSAEQVEYFARQNQQVFSLGETLHLEETIVLPSGIHHFDTYKVPLKNSQGEVYALLGASRDITELIKTQQALSERTAQLEVINKELDSFSYSVSHDLRAPLRHVNGFVNALRQRLGINNALDDPKVTHYLQVIEDSSQKMGDLIDGLLTLSRLGRRELVVSPVDLRQLVENVINLLSSSLEIEQLSAIEFRVGNFPQVKGDMTLLQQVFTNLIGNAIKFTRGRSPAKIEIDSRPDGTIFVKDNGVGFSMQYADQLFGAFQRLHSKQQFEGTGIGLSIVQRIIHRHGGQIWAESAPDQGATFYFTIGKQPLRTDEHGS